MSLLVLVNGRSAAIKEGSTFEFISENPLFTEAEGYTLNIEFPLKDCRQNIEIFGFINRHGHNAIGRPVDMEIRSGINVFRGVGVITSVSDIVCKVQFLSGKSADNYYNSLSEVFVNELDLGAVPSEFWLAKDVSVERAWAGHAGGMDMVAIPYVNENTGNIINNTKRDTSIDTSSGGAPGFNHVWKEPEEAKDVEFYTMYLSWFPYLLDIAKKICKAIDFDFDFTQWENSKWRELLLCNAVPGTWSFDWNLLLPRWSVLEFFQKLEPLLEGFFDFDMINNKIAFRFYSDAIDENIVTVDNVIDEFSSDVFDADETDCKLISQRYVGYAQSSNKSALAYSCDWLMYKYQANRDLYISELETPGELYRLANTNNWSSYDKLIYGPRGGLKSQCFYLKSVDRYVSHRVIQTSWWDDGWGQSDYRNVLCYLRRVPMMFNVFGSRNVPSQESKIGSPDLSIEYVPAVIDDTDMRRMLFMPLGEFEEEFGEPMLEEDMKDGSTLKIWDSLTMRYLEQGNQEKAAYFSNIAVGFYPGASECFRGADEIFPIIDNFEMDLYWYPWYARNKEYTLALDSSAGKFNGVPKVDTNVRFEFSFLSDSMPDVKNVFLIRGKRYLCEKLTTTFSTRGMSRKLKGTFWRID